ncbi:MAG: metallophosphoesterase [Prevotellaceae bacterium]|jgi:predicted MPP superfamily phosphohydrolase|nr:metallophosphoesterase [Prevotellaceae bacterium]
MIFGEVKLPDTITGVLYPIGSTWLAAILYFTMCVVFFDLLRIINHFIPIFPQIITTNYAKVKLITFCVSVTIVAITCIIGNYHFTHPTVTKLELDIVKNAGGKKQLHIVMASDLHLGHAIKNNSLKNYVELINSLKPDIVLFAGDIIDRDLNYVIKEDIGREFKKLNAPLGVYAVLGNHEYISQHVDDAVRYFEQSGITMLCDSVVNIENSFYIVGRDDRTNPQRKPLSSLVDTVDKTLPVITLDHQPTHLEEAENVGIDLQLSGHTHNGQLFPLNYVTQRVYEVSYGYKKKGNTNVYVSSGLGLWGPPFRIGTKSEVVDIILHFE